MLDIEHLEHIGLRKAYHILIFSFRDEISYSQDSNTLLFVNLVDEYYNIPYTLELADNDSIRYLSNPLSNDFASVPPEFWP